jgi:hypothetical protein
MPYAPENRRIAAISRGEVQQKGSETMNQIINMIIRQVMNQLIRKGISAGMNKAGNMGKRREQPMGEIDDYGNPTQPQLTPEERQARREMRQQRRQAKQAMKVTRRVGRF